MIKYISLFVLFAFPFCPTFSFAHGKINNEPRIRSLLEQHWKVPVIVTMNVKGWGPMTEESAALEPGKQGRMPAPDVDPDIAAAISDAAGSIKDSLPDRSYSFKRSFSHLPAMALSVNEEALEHLSADPRVDGIFEDRLYSLPPIEVIPSTFNGISAPSLNESTPLIGAETAWNAGYTGEGVYVAVLDTGVLTSHEMFVGKNIIEACYSSNDSSAYLQGSTVCPNGETSQVGPGAAAPGAGSHGTHVAGIAAGNNPGSTLGEASRGVAPAADIIAVQVFSRFDGTICSDFGMATPCYLSFTSDQMSGLEYVYTQRGNHTIAAVNLSLGSGEYASSCDENPMKSMVDQLRTAGIATVIATGNDGFCDGVGSPSCISSAVAVGASDKGDLEAGYNNYHPTLQEFFAPGSAILSATAVSNSSYASWNGTSMATPHVTGAFALLRESSAGSTVSAMEAALKRTGKPLVGLCPEATGIPRINVDRAIERLLSPEPVNSSFPWFMFLPVFAAPGPG